MNDKTTIKAVRANTKSKARTTINATTKYRITLKVGDFNSLCDAETSELGKQQRMQMLGLFYEPLGINNASKKRRFGHAMRHQRRVLTADKGSGGSKATDSDVEKHLVETLNKEIIVLEGAAKTSASVLPAVGEFAKIKLPCGFAFTPSDGMRPFSYPNKHKHRYNAEDTLYKDNTRIGAVPIIALVETKNKDGDWIPAGAGHKVNLQLIVPDGLVNGSDVAAPDLRTITRVKQTTPAPHGPEKYISDELAAEAMVADDPQVDNCPVIRGGKRNPGAGVASDYFEIVTRIGFNEDTKGKPLYPIAKKSKHPISVVADTNDSSEAGFIFRPSRQGGDRFKLRAFLDPNGLQPSDGTESSAAKIETGTFVIWRTVRISRYIQFDYPAGVSAASKTTAGGNLGTIDFTGHFKRDFARTYMEIIVESSAKMSRRKIGDAQWQQAITYARTWARPRGLSSGPYDMSILFPTVNTSAGLINMLRPVAYDAATAPGSPLANANDWRTLLSSVKDTLIQYYSRQVTSGVVIIQAPQGDVLTVTGAWGASNESTSGEASNRRGMYLFYGNNIYNSGGFPYSLNRNTLHELGHTLYLPHQWTERAAASGAVSGGVLSEHDYKDYCIMSYLKNKRSDYDYCGRCNLKLRGWDTSQIPNNN